jgi:hypothetical protein
MATPNYQALFASNGSGEAVRATVQATRAPGSATITVNATTNWPTGPFIATTGTLQANGTLLSSTVQVFYGTASGTAITITSFAPGYTDKGNAINDVVVLKPATEWANVVSNMFAGNIVPANIASTTAATLTNPYKFSVYTAGAHIYTNFNKVQHDTKLFDTGSNFDATTNNRFTAPVSGFYFFAAAVGLTGTALNDHYISSLYKNGAEVLRGAEINNATGATNLSVQASGLLQLSAGDYVEHWCYVSPGRSIENAAVQTYFQGFLVSAT